MYLSDLILYYYRTIEYCTATVVHFAYKYEHRLPARHSGYGEHVAKTAVIQHQNLVSGLAIHQIQARRRRLQIFWVRP